MMKDKMVAWAIGMFVEQLNSADLKRWMDMGLDLLEDKVAATENEYDDKIVLPICRLIRKSFDIPDNDEEKIVEEIVEKVVEKMEEKITE